MNGNAHLEECLADLRVARAKAVELSEALSPTQLAWQPGKDRWNAGQILDHLLVSGTGYEDKLDRLIRGPEAKRSDGPYTMSFTGRVIAKAAGPGGNAPVPPVFMPRTGAIPPDIARQLVRHLDAMIALAEAARGLDLSPKVASPASKFVRMNVGDVFRVLAEHCKRHLGQIDDLIATPGFPSS